MRLYLPFFGLLITTTALTIILVPSPSFAVRLFRCEGQVQYHPCDTAQLTMITRSAPPVSPGGRIAREYAGEPLYARILKASYKKRKGGGGWWYGWVEGNGQIVLWLVLKERNHLIDRRYMGKVDLANKATTFDFISVPPRSSRWDWDIEVEARPLLK